LKVLLYRSSLSLFSGTGQLLRMQARGLAAAGMAVRIAGERGALKYFLQTGIPARRMTLARAQVFAARAGRAALLVDHDARIAAADLTFVHNVYSAANTFLPRADWAAKAADEARFFRALRADTPIVANSQLSKSALVEHFGLSPERILVHYPGYRTEAFSAAAAAVPRMRARGRLGLDASMPLIGFVTSGDFRKRGLDIFLAAAAEIVAAVPDAHFLVVGSKRLPDEARADPLVRAGRVAYRPKSREPQLWMAALDVFLYPARFEEFGIVVAEALALGVPVLTSRRVGAAECMPEVYRDWLLDEPQSGAFAAKAVALLDDAAARKDLAAAGVAHAARFDRESYVRATLRTILDQKR
jgi:glycosyltransferase involved in cell wall biosynthesis